MALATRQPDRRTEAADLRMEVRALHSERDAVLAELHYLRGRLDLAYRVNEWRYVAAVHNRIVSLEARLERRGAA